MADVESLQSYSPLLGTSDHTEQDSLTAKPSTCNIGCARNYQRRRVLFVGIPCMFLAMLFGAGITFLAHNGAFSHIERDVRIVNGTVIEPNTKLVFPVERPVLIDGATKRVQRLIGVFLKTKHVPEIDSTLHVFVLALYVDRAEGRKELMRYRDGPPHAHQSPREFDKFVQAISSGKMTVTGEYRMVLSPPGSTMHDHWAQSLVDLWIGYGATPSQAAALKGCFSSWFQHSGFHNKDDVLIEFNSKTKQTKASMNGKKLDPTCVDPLFGRGFVEHEFRENGELAADLLPTMWNTDYDTYQI